MSKTISWGQMLILLLVVKIFTLMTFVPLVANGYTPTSQLLGTLVSIAVQAVLIIPIILLVKGQSNKSITAIVLSNNRVIGVVVALLYFAFFFCYSVNAVIHFENFIRERFFPSANEYISVAVFLLVCAYCSHLGMEGIARSAVLLFAVFTVTFVVIFLISIPHYNSLNFYYDASWKDNLFYAVTDDMARNGEIVALALLATYIKEKFSKAAFWLVPSKLVISLAAAFLIIGVLGDFANLTDYPFLAVSAHAGVGYIGRSDAIFMILWTLTSVVAVSLTLTLTGEIFKETAPKMKYKTLIIAAFVFAVVMFFIKTEGDFSAVYYTVCSAYSIVLLLFIIPLIVLLCTKKGGKK